MLGEHHVVQNENEPTRATNRHQRLRKTVVNRAWNTSAVGQKKTNSQTGPRSGAPKQKSPRDAEQLTENQLSRRRVEVLLRSQMQPEHNPR